MATFNENVDVNGQLTVTRPWSDWAFLRQQRDQGGGGGFHVHNPWGNSTAPQGHASRNRLEIGYRTSGGQDLWGQVVVHGPTGRVGLGIVDPQARLHVNGSIIVTDDVILQNADCAEDFPVSEEAVVEPGTVTVLDEEGLLKPSDRPYDTRVAGVVSGAGDLRPGIVLGRTPSTSEARRATIALAGRVYCRVDAEFGAIRPGNLLTTSERPGHAMRVTDRREAVGAVVGKALQRLEAGAGVIPILVTLQ